MDTLRIVFFCFIGVYLLAYLYLLLLSGKPIRYLFFNAFISWWCFLVVNLLSFLTKIHIPLNPATVLTSGALGVPGTVLLILLKYCIFI